MMKFILQDFFYDAGIHLRKVTVL